MTKNSISCITIFVIATVCTHHVQALSLDYLPFNLSPLVQQLRDAVKGGLKNAGKGEGNVQIGGEHEFDANSKIQQNINVHDFLTRNSESDNEGTGKLFGKFDMKESVSGSNALGKDKTEGSGQGAGDIRFEGAGEFHGKRNSSSDTTLKGLGSQVNIKSTGQHKGYLSFQTGLTGSGQGSGFGKVAHDAVSDKSEDNSTESS